MSLSFEDILKDAPDKSFIINYAPLFANLTLAEKKLIAEKSQVVEYKKGSVIYKQSDPPDAFYCLVSGRVRIFSMRHGRKETIEYLNCGKYFGIISLLTGEPHSVSAEAANDSKILKIDKQDFQELLGNIPGLAVDLSKTLSRRLRKKDIQEKRIFESSIVSVFSTVKSAGVWLYANNLALSLKKETARNVILVNVLERPEDESGVLNLLQTPFISDANLKQAIRQDAASGLNILNIACDSQSDTVYGINLNFLIGFLTADFHFVVVNLPSLMNRDVVQILSQSDIIHIITDYDTRSLQEAKSLISSLLHEVKYPQDKIKVIINADRIGKSFSSEEASRLLGYGIYALLPVCSDTACRAILEEPQSAYAVTLRRIAREIGGVRVGLALSGGAAYGMAHIGVIKVLEQEGIPIDAVAGSSIGAAIAALWACGLDSRGLNRVASELNNKKKVLRLLIEPHFPKLAFSKGRRIKAFLERHIGKTAFQDAKFPLRIVACNLTKRQELIYDSGKIIDAVMASIAIPGVFSPVRVGSDLILDGGIIDPVAIGALVKMGMNKIIAVNVFPSPENIIQSNELKAKSMEEKQKLAESRGWFAKIIHRLGLFFNRMFFPNILDVIVNSIQTLEYVIAESDCEKADVVIRPQAAGVDWFEFFKAGLLMEKGEEETRRALEAIKRVVSE